MAANFWESTQRKNWQFTKEQLASMRQKLEDEDPSLIQMYPLPEWRHLYIYFNREINRLGKRIQLRQQALATAQVYLKRFFMKVEIRRTNPLLVAVTAVYLACKMEETPQHIRYILNESRTIFAELHNLEIPKIGECEFFLISEMHSQMIVHQPYRTLIALRDEFGLTSDESSLAWSFINDHYMTDLPLLYPPHTIALTAILLALTLGRSTSAAGAAGGSTAAGGPNDSGGPLRLSIAAANSLMQQSAARTALQGGNGGVGVSGTTQSPAAGQQAAGEKTKLQKFAAWLADSSVDVEAMVDCTQELISFYDCHEQYNEKATKDQIHRYVKARGL